MKRMNEGAIQPPPAKRAKTNASGSKHHGAFFYRQQGANSQPRNEMIANAEVQHHTLAIQWQQPKPHSQREQGVPANWNEKAYGQWKPYYRSFGSYANPGVFFRMYQAMEPTERCMYEYIQPGPCKLYADVEWMEDLAGTKPFHQQRELARRLESLLRHVQWAWKELRGQEWSKLNGSFLWMDSSREKPMAGHSRPFWRYSLHVVHTGIVFGSPVEQRGFWRLVLHHALATGDKDFVYAKPTAQGGFKAGEAIADTSVYRSMGELRLLYSCKYGELTSKLRGWDAELLETDLSTDMDEHLFVASLVGLYAAPSDARPDLFPEHREAVTGKAIADALQRNGLRAAGAKKTAVSMVRD